jgi:hypothetical protein
MKTKTKTKTKIRQRTFNGWGLPDLVMNIGDISSCCGKHRTNAAEEPVTITITWNKNP